MSGVAVNDAGDVLTLQDGQWRPAQVAQNGRGERVYLRGNEWVPVPVAQSTGARAVEAAGGAVQGAAQAVADVPGSWWGRRARDVVEGLASFPSAAADAISGPGVAFQRAMMPREVQQSRAPTISDLATRGADAMGLARPQTDEERMTSAVVQGVVGAIPTMGVGAGTGAVQRGVNYLSQAVGGGAGGYAAESVGQAGYGPTAQLAAGLVGGLGGAGAVQGAATAARGLGAALQPFGQGGRERIVADTLLRSAADPDNLGQRIQRGADDADMRLPGSPVSTALAARDPQLLGVEASIRDGALGVDVARPLRDAGVARARVQEGAISALGDGQQPGERGAAVRGERGQGARPGTGLRGAEQARRAEVSRAYEAIDPEGTARLPVGPIRAVVQEELADRWGQGSGAMPEKLQRLFNDVESAGEVQSWRVLQRLRSQANDIAGRADATASERTSAQRVIARIDATAESAAMPVQPAGASRTLDDLDRAEGVEGLAARPDVRAVMADQRSATADARAGGLPLAQFVRQRGGLAESASEVADGRRMPGLFSRGGQDIDRAMQAAIDAGYYPGRSIQHDAVTPGITLTRAEFLRDIGEELNGRGRVFPVQRQSAREEVAGRQALRDSVERDLEGSGASLRDDPSRVGAAVRPIDENAPAAPMNADDGTFYIPPDQRFSPEQAQRWRDAAALRRSVGEDFERDSTGARATGAILDRANYGMPGLVDERVASTALANLSSLRQVLRASADDPQVRRGLQGQFMDNLARRALGKSETIDTSGISQRTSSPAGFRRFWDDNRAMARELFSPQEFRRLELISRDFAEMGIGANTGSTRNSQTVQNMSVANMIARVSNGLLDDNPLARAAVGGPVLRWLYRDAEMATRDLLGQAMADPRLAAMLLSRAGPGSMRRASAYIEQNMRDRLTGSANVAGFRQTVRTSGEEERRRAQ